MIPTTCVVALPIPVSKPYSYAIPTSIADRVVPGSRVLVPVRSRELIGVVLEVGDGSAEGLKAVMLAPDAGPLLPQSLLDLGIWISNYYTTPIGLTIRAMLPPALWGGSRLVAQLLESHAGSGGTSRDILNILRRAGGRMAAATLTRKLRRPVWDTLQRLARSGIIALETEPAKLGPAPRTETVIVLDGTTPSILERESLFGRAARQRSAYEAIEALGGEALVNHLRTQLGFSTAVLKGLVGRGVARMDTRERLRDPFSGIAGVSPPSPNEAQQSAATTIR